MGGDVDALLSLDERLGDLLENLRVVFGRIHLLYADWSNRTPDSHNLSYHVDLLSRLLWRIQKLVPDEHLRRLAEELGTMAKELQTAPKRDQYYTMPRLRYLH
jgi:hypothetical protein